MRRIQVQIIILLLFPQLLSAFQDYQWPTNASRYITSSFGEYRERRFHTGFDIKTWGRNGYRVYAVESGYVWRIRISPYGYGKALYLKLNDGNYAVYGHLRNFNKVIGDVIREEQKKTGKFSIDKFFQKNQIKVNKGDLVAYTGYTGTRFPHLHFEIRDKNNKPLNPLLFGFKPVDKRAPVIKNLAFTPLNVNSMVNNNWHSFIAQVRRIDRNTYIVPDTLKIWGNVGISVSTYDITGETTNKFCPYKLRLKINGREIFKGEYKKLDFNKNHLITLDRDYRLHIRRDEKFMKLYIDKGNTLDIYPGYNEGDGIISFNSINYTDRVFSFTIEVSDFHENTSTATGYIKISNPSGFIYEEHNSTVSSYAGSGRDTSNSFIIVKDFLDDFLRLEVTGPFELASPPEVYVTVNEEKSLRLNVLKKNDKSYVTVYKLPGIEGRLKFTIQGFSEKGIIKNEFEENLNYIPLANIKNVSFDEYCSISFNKQSLFKDLWIRKSPGVNRTEILESKFIGNLYMIAPDDIPLNGGAAIQMKIPDSAERKDKLGIYFLYEDKWVYLNSRRDEANDILSANIVGFGLFGIIEDSEPPEITRVIPANGSTVSTSRPSIRVYLKDELSGFRNEEDIMLFLDNKKVIAEYQPPRDVVTYRPPAPLGRGRHTIKVISIDNMQNRIEKETTFIRNNP